MRPMDTSAYRPAYAAIQRAVKLAPKATAYEREMIQAAIDLSQTKVSGTVRLKRDVNKLDEMELDTASTKTTRVRPQ